MTLPLLVILRSVGTKDLGLESGKTKSENQHRDPSGGEAALRMTALFVILSAAVCHPEAGTIAEGSRPCLCLSSRTNAIAQHPRRGVILTLPLLVILRSAATKDLGLESGPNHKRDPSAMGTAFGILIENQTGAGSRRPRPCRSFFIRMWIHNYKPCIAFFRETPNFPKIVRAVGENEIPCKSYLLNFLKGLSIGDFF